MDDATAKDLGLEALAVGFEPAPCLTRAAYGVRGGDGCLWRHTAGSAPRWPDFRDPATLGVLLAQVRAALADGDTHAERLFTGEWAVFNQHGNLVSDKGPTEAHALVAALQAAKEV